jgi:hypothetical protein
LLNVEPELLEDELDADLQVSETLSETKKQGKQTPVARRNCSTIFLPKGIYDKEYQHPAIISINNRNSTKKTFCFSNATTKTIMIIKR